MRILITGGAGCLGSNLIEKFIPAGHQVLVVDNFATGKREVLPPVEGLTVIDGDIQDNAIVERAFDTIQPTHVIHSAAAYKDPSDWQSDVNTNVSGTINVANAAMKFDVKRFINFQTALCYGRPDIVPIPVEHPTRPFTSYGISKTAGEQYLSMTGLPLVSLRLANVTGPRLAIGPIPTFYQRLKENKPCFCSETVRDFIDMEDFLTLMDLVLEDGASTGIYNVSTGKGSSIREVFDCVANYLNIYPEDEVPSVPPGADDVPTVVLDPKLTNETFSWSAKYEFPEIISRMLAWYDAHGVTDIHSHLAAPGR